MSIQKEKIGEDFLMLQGNMHRELRKLFLIRYRTFLFFLMLFDKEYRKKRNLPSFYDERRTQQLFFLF